VLGPEGVVALADEECPQGTKKTSRDSVPSLLACSVACRIAKLAELIVDGTPKIVCAAGFPRRSGD
jgi:hypothetical protein